MRWLIRGCVVVLISIALSTPAEAHHPTRPCMIPVPAAGPQLTEEEAQRRERVLAFADGSGVRVAVIDTGVAPSSHVRVVPGGDFVAPQAPNPLSDCDGHGTAVAGVIASRNAGVAPGVEIVSIRQTSAHYGEGPEASGNLGTLTEAIHSALDQGVDVINMSVVSCAPAHVAATVDDSILRAALARAEAENVVVVVAAGNTGPGCEPGDVVYPAHYPTVIAVGAVDDNNRLAPYSMPVIGEEQQVVVAARGDVPVALSSRGWASGLQEGDSLRAAIIPYQGTSFAAPVVTGTVAVLRQRYPEDSAAQIRHRIELAAVPHAGVVDPYQALTVVPNNAPPQPRTVNVGEPDKPAPEPRARAVSVLAGMLAVLLAAAVLAGAGRRV